MDIHYQVKRITTYGEYTAVVSVSRATQQTTITLYEGEPSYQVFGFFNLNGEPIQETVISSSSDVHKTLKNMIREWEYPLYQQDRAQTAASTLDIDHAEELKRERLRLKLEADEEEQEFTAILNDFIEGKFQMNNDGVTPIKKSGYNEKSKQNLVQFRDPKAK